MTKEEFRRRRQALGSLQAVGEALGYGTGRTAQGQVWRMEHGKRPIPRRVALAIRCLELRPSLMDPEKEP